MSAALDAAGFGRGRPEEAGLDAEILEDHRRRIHMHRDAGVFPGMAECIAVDGKVVYLDCCGFSHPESSTRMTERTLFRGYSMMKPITTVTFFTLVEEGLLRVGDPVSKYLPGFADLKVRKKSGEGLEALRRPMTLRHLLMHTSGIGYGPGVTDRGQQIVARSVAEKTYKDISLRQDMGDIDTLEKLIDALAQKPLLFQPGAAYEYGLSFDVLGRVMEVASGRPLHELITERVLRPAGMLDATWDVPKARAKQVCGYFRILKKAHSSARWLQRLDGAAPEQSAYVRGSRAHVRYPGPLGASPSGGGFWGTHRTGLLFSMRDILSFCQLLLNEGVSATGSRILKASTLRALRRNWLVDKKAVDSPMPSGWTSDSVGWNPLGHVQLDGSHAGALYMGGMSYFWLDPRRKLASVIMTETYWQVQPLGWKGDTDTLESVIGRACEAATEGRKRRRPTAGEEAAAAVGAADGRAAKARRRG